MFTITFSGGEWDGAELVAKSVQVRERYKPFTLAQLIDGKRVLVQTVASEKTIEYRSTEGEYLRMRVPHDVTFTVALPTPNGATSEPPAQPEQAADGEQGPAADETPAEQNGDPADAEKPAKKS